MNKDDVIQFNENHKWRGCLGYCDDDDFESYDYEDNSHLVYKKIEELKYELNRRKGNLYG